MLATILAERPGYLTGSVFNERGRVRGRVERRDRGNSFYLRWGSFVVFAEYVYNGAIAENDQRWWLGKKGCLCWERNDKWIQVWLSE